MKIGVIGINHKSADLKLRETLARACQRRFHPQNAAHSGFSYVLLSTCNRTEIYFSSEDLAETHTYILGILRFEVEEEFEHRIYSYFSSDCFLHLAMVTAGVDSAIIGETEIQGQVKKAYEVAIGFQTICKELHFLFQKSLKIGKEVRSKVNLTPLLTIEEAILKAAQNLIHELLKKSVLFVGISEINHKIFKRFKQKGFQNITFCNRSKEKATALAADEKIHLLSWEELPRWTQYDLVIFGTKCPHFLASREHCETKMTCKLICDLSVPRNVDPKITKHDVMVLNVDQLNSAIDRKRKIKAYEIAKMETHMIAKAIEIQMGIFRLKEERIQSLYSKVS